MSRLPQSTGARALVILIPAMSVLGGCGGAASSQEVALVPIISVTL
ncbi:hypothetical protein OKW41_009235 [Paraburkholderia sp. UCT70]